jgi:hypothetical protein
MSFSATPFTLMLFSEECWIFSIKRLSINAETIIPTEMAMMVTAAMATTDFFIPGSFFCVIDIEVLSPDSAGRRI